MYFDSLKNITNEKIYFHDSHSYHWKYSPPSMGRASGNVIKSGPAWRVDPGPGGWTDPDLIKDRLWQQPGQTRAIRPVDLEPGRDPVFFLQMWDLKPISIYTLCSHEKNHVFSMWNKKPLSLNIST